MSVNVIFVCLGNICRSPMAEAVFQQMVAEAGLSDEISVDSAGTGSWQVGEQAHAGTRRILRQHNIPYHGRARQVKADDLAPGNYIIAMDNSNRRTLEQRFGAHEQLFQLLSFAHNTDETEVPDPYYTDNFEYVYQLVEDGCRGLLAEIRKREGL